MAKRTAKLPSEIDLRSSNQFPLSTGKRKSSESPAMSASDPKRTLSTPPRCVQIITSELAPYRNLSFNGLPDTSVVHLVYVRHIDGVFA